MSIATEQRAQVSVQIGDSEISFETGKLAKQADGAVVVRSGDTMVLATAVGRPEAREGADFFPLTIDVEERMYAAGKIPGGFFKREGRASERATLTARMIDRPIRPLWPKGFRNEVQVICTVLSADMVTPHDILCINGASAALCSRRCRSPARSVQSASAASTASSSSTRRCSRTGTRRRWT
jgi:polyribonucleotide nucleotidyltransferase